MGKKRFKIEIGGKEYIIIGEGSQERMNAVVQLANEKLEKIKEQIPDIRDEKATTLLAINAFSEQLELQEELDKYTEK